MDFLKRFKTNTHKPVKGIRNFLKYVGPGLLVTVGFIDPGNWASNISSGADYGYVLLWMVTLSTIMLIVLQHNAAHLGIVTGDCLSESATKNLSKKVSIPVLITSLLAVIATTMAEVLGGAIALKMLFHLPIELGAILVSIFVLLMMFSHSYAKLERYIIAFVSLIGISFIIELAMVPVDWNAAAKGWVTVSLPDGSIPIVMAVLGAVVMPHNLFLHSEVIQSREFNTADDKVIKKQLKYEFLDTLFSMIVGWGINSAMIILAAATFFKNGIAVSELESAQRLLAPMLGNMASVIFALALLFAGISSTMTALMAGGSIFAGMFNEPYDIKDFHSKFAVVATLVISTIIIFFVSDPFEGLIYSQMLLSIQLPITVFLQIYLTSSEKIMGKYKNTAFTKVLLIIIAIILTILNVMLFKELL